MILLQVLHLIAGICHIAQSITVTVLTSRRKRIPQYDITLPTSYEKTSSKTNCSYLQWLVPMFSLLSAANHLIAVVFYTNSNYITLLSVSFTAVGWRWIEYTFSASIMIWIIAQLSGISNIFVLFSLVNSNVLLQFTGYLIESTGDNNYLFTTLGYFLFITTWIPIICTFIVSLCRAKKKPACYIYCIVFGQLFLFLTFGLVSTISLYYLKRGNDDRATIIKWREISYIILSITAKTLLTWLVYGGVINAKETSKKII
jgi:hypothetical protein